MIILCWGTYGVKSAVSTHLQGDGEDEASTAHTPNCADTETEKAGLPDTPFCLDGDFSRIPNAAKE